MPGICGFVCSDWASGGAQRVLDTMLRGLIHAAWHESQSRCDPAAGVGVGVVALADARRRQVAWDEATSSGLVLDGELFESARVAEGLRREGVQVSADDHAGILLAGWRLRGGAFLRQLHGSFAAAIWDGATQQLTLLTDRLASRPVYYRQDGRELRFSSGLASLVAGDDTRQRINPRGLAQFFTFGHYLRDDTALAGVRVLPTAACFTFDVGGQRLAATTYWSLREAKVAALGSRQGWLEQIDDAFGRAVRRCTADTPDLGLSLSGGLDARTLLGAIDARQTPLTAVCMGVQGSLDHRSSAELAALSGCRYHAHVLDAAFLANFRSHLDRMVRLTDGQYLSQCIVIPTLGVYRELGIRTLLRGHAGELMHMRKAYNYSLDAAALQIRTSSQLRAWLLGHLPAFLLKGVTEPLFAPAYQSSLRELAEQSLDEDLAEVGDMEQPLQRIWRLFVTQRLRRETVLSMAKFRTVVEPRLPFLDAELIPLLVTAPHELKLGEEIQSFILRRRRPEFLRVTNANTGARLGAGRWPARLATLQMKVLAKLGVPGYQPYEKLGRWLRRELAEVVRDVLLDPQTLDRGVFAPDGVRAVVRGHQEQGRNHTYLLMALMIFELGLRRLLDGEGDRSCESADGALQAVGVAAR